VYPERGPGRLQHRVRGPHRQVLLRRPGILADDVNGYARGGAALDGQPVRETEETEDGLEPMIAVGLARENPEQRVHLRVRGDRHCG
jgi:hypothetical protein